SFHLHHHHPDHDPDSDGIAHLSVGFLMTSMVAHCLASGMFLALSRDLSSSVERGVFWALIAHKGYEALSVSLVLQERLRSPRRLLWLTAAYALSLPAGVALTVGLAALMGGAGYDEAWLRTAAMVMGSIAAGSLMGCMVHDFLIPSYHHVRERR